MPKSRPPYPAAFRQQMVELVRSGRTPGDLAREFEPSADAIRNWVAQADRRRLHAPGVRTNRAGRHDRGRPAAECRHPVRADPARRDPHRGDGWVADARRRERARPRTPACCDHAGLLRRSRSGVAGARRGTVRHVPYRAGVRRGAHARGGVPLRHPRLARRPLRRLRSRGRARSACRAAPGRPPAGSRVAYHARSIGGTGSRRSCQTCVQVQAEQPWEKAIRPGLRRLRQSGDHALGRCAQGLGRRWRSADQALAP